MNASPLEKNPQWGRNSSTPSKVSPPFIPPTGSIHPTGFTPTDGAQPYTGTDLEVDLKPAYPPQLKKGARGRKKLIDFDSPRLSYGNFVKQSNRSVDFWTLMDLNGISSVVEMRKTFRYMSRCQVMTGAWVSDRERNINESQTGNHRFLHTSKMSKGLGRVVMESSINQFRLVCRYHSMLSQTSPPFNTQPPTLPGKRTKQQTNALIFHP